jgi:putative cell wall-binding protein
LKQSHRNRLVVAAAGLMAATSIVAIAPWSGASLPGESNLLTSSNGTGSIMREGQTALSVTGTTVTEAAWSHDGSRAVFVSADDALYTARYTGATAGAAVAAIRMLPAAAGVQRASPTWSGDGASFVYAEQSGPGEPWHLSEMLAGKSDLPDQLTPDDDGFNDTNPDAGDGVTFVFQREPESGGTPEIWLRGQDFSLSPILSDGRNPALSPNGLRVAFVRSDEIWVANLDGSGLTQLTDTPTTKDNPVWSFDDATIAFSNDGGVATVPASLTEPATSVTTIAGLTGVPAYQTHVTNDVMRLAGTDRFKTAVEVSQFMWNDAGDTEFTADAVVLSRSDNFPDALGGAALAAAKNGPLLLTRPTSLDTSTRNEMLRVLGTSSPASKTVYVLGGEGAISTGVVNSIRALTSPDYNIVRLAGAAADQYRYGTAIKIANEIDPTPDLVLVATGLNFPDGLAAGAAAGSFIPFGIPAVVVLSQGYALPQVTKNYLDALPDTTEVYGVGGFGATAAAAYVEPGNLGLGTGHDRYETAALVADAFFNGDFWAGVATGENWPDALAGGAAMGVLNGPLLISKGSSGTLNSFTRDRLILTCGSVDVGLIFGGAVAGAQATQIGQAISGPNGFIVSEPLPGAAALTSVNLDAKDMRGPEVLRNLNRTNAGGSPAKALPGR